MRTPDNYLPTCPCDDCRRYRAYLAETKRITGYEPGYQVSSSGYSRQQLDHWYALNDLEAAKRRAAELARALENSLPLPPEPEPETAEQKALKREKQIARSTPDDSTPFWTEAKGDVLAQANADRLDISRDVLRSWWRCRENYAASGDERDLELMLGHVTMTVPPLISDVDRLYGKQKDTAEQKARGQWVRQHKLPVLIAVLAVLWAILQIVRILIGVF